MSIHFKTYTFDDKNQIGKGKFCEVISGTSPRGSRVVAKLSRCLGEEVHLLAQVNKLKIPHANVMLASGSIRDREVVVLDRAYSSHSQNQSLNILETLIKNGIHAFSGFQIISCMKQLFEFLADLNRYGILHRDIKCANMVFDQESGRLTVVDYGQARFKHSHSNLDAQGTVHAQAPEILLRQSVLKYAVDVWGAGVVLYMMYTGGTPFGDGRDKVFSTIFTNVGIPKDEYLKTCWFRREALVKKTGKEYRRDWRGKIRLAAEQRAAVEKIDPKKQAEQIIHLLEQIFRFDDERITAREALKHPLFEGDVELKLDCKGLSKGYTLSIAGLEIPLTPQTDCIHIQKTFSNEYSMSILDAGKKCILICKEKLVPGSRIRVLQDPTEKIAMRIKGPFSIQELLEKEESFVEVNPKAPSKVPYSLNRLQGTCFI